MRARTAVIPAAGMGTRFLPATKAVPKELLPIIDTPALQLIIDEAVGAGIQHVVIVTSHAKPAIEAFFEPAPDLVERLRVAGRSDAADSLERGELKREQVSMQSIRRWLADNPGKATEILHAGPFYPDEEYHQDYFRCNPYAPYCQVVVAAKVSKLLKKHPEWVAGS
mgnify:CR=1 FL=1